MSKKKAKKTIYTTYEARTKFSSLLKRVQEGEEIIITNRYKEVAKLIPTCSESSEERQPGSAKGSFVMSNNFDDPLPEEFMKAFLIPKENQIE